LRALRSDATQAVFHCVRCAVWATLQRVRN